MKTTPVRLTAVVNYPCMGELLPGLAVVGKIGPDLPIGYICGDTGIRMDKPEAALIRHLSGRYSWVPAKVLEAING